MRLSNRPTRGTPLTEDEKKQALAMRPHWWGGARITYTKSYGKPGGGNGARGSRRDRGRSDWKGR